MIVKMVNTRLGQFKKDMNNPKIDAFVLIGMLLSIGYGVVMPITGKLLSQFIGESANPKNPKF